ncbi:MULTISPECIES: TetR family transcriptional regulator [Variovorax]|uniref:TetR family transcriptional regulator n=1 Tax=Variovorax TaxID=34072 RepID=UPI0027D7F340|nr:TetR family transcriptional regulator [Variovorax boronicumulans]
MVARRTKEEALATRHRLLDAAELLFQAQGVSQTTLQQIAQQAGATRGAIYWHFKDKADLFNAMMERVILPLEAAPKPATAGVTDDPLAEIEEGMIHALTLMATDPQVRRVFDVATHKVEYTHDMASVQQRHLDARNACVGDFEKALRLAARRGHIKLPLPGNAAAQGLHALISGLIQNWLLDPEAFDLVHTGRRTFRVYLAGLGFARPLPGTAVAAEAETVAA